MNKTIIVISTQYPGYGGAGTNAYALIKYLRERKYRTIGIFVEDNKNIDVDPEKMGGILRFDYYPFRYQRMAKILGYRRLLYGLIKGLPSIILCKNYFAPICSRMLYPMVPNLCLVSGLDNIIVSRIAASQILDQNVTIPESQNDTDAFNSSSLVVVNSPLTLKLFNHCYPNFKNKIHPVPIDTSSLITNLIPSHDTATKCYDFIITSSILTRPEKNNLFLVNLLKNPSFDKYTKIIVGKENDIFHNIPNTTLFGLLPHSGLMDLMKKSKVLLYPSLYDSSPNTVREAVHNKCLLLVSNNIGYCEKFPEYSVCQTYEVVEWMEKSLNLINHYDDLIDNYRIESSGSDQNLLQLVNQFTG